MELTMNSATMEIKIDNDSDDALSLRDLQMYDHTAGSSPRTSPTASSAHELFEFFTTRSDPAETGDVVFCGKVIPGSSSFRLPERDNEDAVPLRSVSNRDPVSARHSVKFSSSVKKVNITALTSMSSKSRRRMFMFGPVKFKPEMELSAIRERQGRRTPSPMFPVTEGSDAAETGKVVAEGKKNHWGMVRTMRCRAQLNTVFERSFACLRP